MDVYYTNNLGTGTKYVSSSMPWQGVHAPLFRIAGEHDLKIYRLGSIYPQVLSGMYMKKSDGSYIYKGTVSLQAIEEIIMPLSFPLTLPLDGA